MNLELIFQQISQEQQGYCPTVIASTFNTAKRCIEKSDLYQEVLECLDRESDGAEKVCEKIKELIKKPINPQYGADDADTVLALSMALVKKNPTKGREALTAFWEIPYTRNWHWAYSYHVEICIQTDDSAPFMDHSRRSGVFERVVEDGGVTLRGYGSDTGYTARIYVTSKGVGLDFLEDDKIMASSIPALNVYEWDKYNIRYLKDWLYEILGDNVVAGAKIIKITSSGGWRGKFQGRLNYDWPIKLTDNLE